MSKVTDFSGERISRIRRRVLEYRAKIGGKDKEN